MRIPMETVLTIQREKCFNLHSFWLCGSVMFQIATLRALSKFTPRMTAACQRERREVSPWNSSRRSSISIFLFLRQRLLHHKQWNGICRWRRKITSRQSCVNRGPGENQWVDLSEMRCYLHAKRKFLLREWKKARRWWWKIDISSRRREWFKGSCEEKFLNSSCKDERRNLCRKSFTASFLFWKASRIKNSFLLLCFFFQIIVSPFPHKLGNQFSFKEFYVILCKFELFLSSLSRRKFYRRRYEA